MYVRTYTYVYTYVFVLQLDTERLAVKEMKQRITSLQKNLDDQRQSATVAQQDSTRRRDHLVAQAEKKVRTYIRTYVRTYVNVHEYVHLYNKCTYVLIVCTTLYVVTSNNITDITFCMCIHTYV